jgi:acetyl esterase/lipase
MNLDPALFRPEAIDDESKALIVQLKAMAAEQPPMHTLSPADVRSRRASTGRGPGGQPVFLSENATIRSIPGPAGDIELRCFIPPQANAAYLYIHGGGWVLGTNDSNDLRLENLSRDFGIAVVSVEYRLAPEHPYPAGPDDCEAAALWLAQNAAREFGTDKLLIGGDSAGAHLAVVSLVRLRDRHGITPYSGAILGYGFYDPALTPSAANWGDESVILSTPSLQWFSDHFVPPEKRRDPDVNPLFADLRDMPPAILTVGTMDPLLDDSLFMHARWVGAGSHAELDVQPGGVHGLTGFPTSVGKNALAHQDAFIKSILAS